MPNGMTMTMQDPAAVAVQEKAAETKTETKPAAKRKAKAKVTA